MKFYLSYVLAVFLLGCETELLVLKNTSPEKVSLQKMQQLDEIPMRIRIVADEQAFVNDVSSALLRNHVIQSVDSIPSPKDLLLKLSHNTKSSHYNKTRGNQEANDFDYSIMVNATLLYKGQAISNYSSLGSYHSEVPNNATLEEKIKCSAQAVELSFNHALNLLSVKIKQDKDHILSRVAGLDH